MVGRRRTLASMNRDRLIARICDIVLEQGGDWDATGRVLGNEFTGDDLEQAEQLALWVLANYEEPGLGPDVVRMMRDRRRRLVPVQPAGAPGRGFWRR
jgi:hypothetical protein